MKCNICYFVQIFRFLKKFHSILVIFLIFLVFVIFKGSKKHPKMGVFLGQTGCFYFFFINLDVYLVSLYHVWNEKFLALIKKNSLNMQFFEILLLSKKIQKWSKKALKKSEIAPKRTSNSSQNFFF